MALPKIPVANTAPVMAPDRMRVYFRLDKFKRTE